MSRTKTDRIKRDRALKALKTDLSDSDTAKALATFLGEAWSQSRSRQAPDKALTDYITALGNLDAARETLIDRHGHSGQTRENLVELELDRLRAQVYYCPEDEAEAEGSAVESMESL
jgi:hypothetical protein